MDAGKPARQPVRTDFFMVSILGPIGYVVGNHLQQVADIVQQGRNDQRVRRMCHRGLVSGLQAVFGHGNRFTVICGIAAAGKQLPQFLDHVHVGPLPRKRRRNSPVSLKTLSRVK